MVNYFQRVRITSRWNKREAPKIDRTARTSSSTTTLNVRPRPSTCKPASSPKNMAKNGTMIQTDNCCAERGSFTRDEIASIAAMATVPSKGVQSRKTTSQPGLTIAEKTRPLMANAAVPITNNVPLAQVTIRPGMSAARHLLNNSSQVRTGVSRSGSSVLLVFSQFQVYFFKRMRNRLYEAYLGTCRHQRLHQLWILLVWVVECNQQAVILRRHLAHKR